MSIYAFQLPEREHQFTPLYFDKFLSPDECKQLLSIYEGKPTWSGGVVDDKGNDQDIDAIRRVDVNTVELTNQTKWVYDKLNDLIQSANEVYQFDITGFMENMQLLRYSEPQDERPGGHYDMHSDTGPGYLSTRKLTAIIQLTDGDEYDGCDVEVIGHGYAKRNIGDALVFPAPMLHQVTELISGHREALIVWVNGTPFR